MAGQNLEPMLSVYENDPDMGTIVALFVAEMPDRRDDLGKAIEAGDLSKAIRIAHQLKGAAGGYGFGSLGTVAAASERALLDLLDANNSEVAAIRAAATPLFEACGRVRLSSSESAA